LAEQDEAVLAAVRAALPDLLRTVVQLATVDLNPGIAAVQRRCPRCDRRVCRHSCRRRIIHTTRGPLPLRRPWYHCPACGQGFSPVDATLALPLWARISPALEAWLVRLNVTTTQREAAALLTELTGLVVGMDTIREHTTAIGEGVAAEDSVAIAHVAATGEAAAAVGRRRGRWWSRLMGRWCAPPMAGTR
jgi:transposase